MAQFESQKIREDFKQKIHQLSHKSDLLLREQSQQIELAKIICPVYDADAEVWMEVTTISKMMKTVKEEIAEVEQLQVIALGETDTSTNLVSQFLKSVVASPVKAISTKEVEVLTPNKEVLVVNEILEIDDI